MISKPILPMQRYVQNILSRMRNRAKAAKDRGVTICTMHASKGLEWDTVFIASCNQGVIPFERQDSDCDTEEERRLMYVAVTRAKKNVISL